LADVLLAAVVLCFVLLGIVVLPFSALQRRRMSFPLRRIQDVEGQKAGCVEPYVDHHSAVTSLAAVRRGCPEARTGRVMSRPAVSNCSIPTTLDEGNTTEG